MAAEDFEYVRFVCPVCGETRQFCREDRWGQGAHTNSCMAHALGGYFRCTARIEILTENGKTYVKVNGKPVAATLTNQHPNTYGGVKMP